MFLAVEPTEEDPPGPRLSGKLREEHDDNDGNSDYSDASSILDAIPDIETKFHLWQSRGHDHAEADQVARPALQAEFLQKIGTLDIEHRAVPFMSDMLWKCLMARWARPSSFEHWFIQYGTCQEDVKQPDEPNLICQFFHMIKEAESVTDERMSIGLLGHAFSIVVSPCALSCPNFTTACISMAYPLSIVHRHFSDAMRSQIVKQRFVHFGSGKVHLLFWRFRTPRCNFAWQTPLNR